MSKEFSDNEKLLIEETDVPGTRESLAQDLRNLGVKAGMLVEVHASLSNIGWVCGGSVAVVQALMDVVTDVGTLVMPTQTHRYSDPAKWRFPSVPQSWLPTLYEALPAFDPQVTPTQLMGQIAETFRTWPGVVRSSHPTVSFAAWGKYAQTIIANHSLDYGLGEGSPLARIYDLHGHVLLLGVSYNKCTSLHLAEYRARNPKQTTERSPLLENGQRVWKTYHDIELDTTQFLSIAGEFESKYSNQDVVKTDFVGSAIARLFPQRLAVDCAVAWINKWNPTRQ
ncbi:MAG: AAC(3) family N-acetyltransferase [Ktedonobacteraceae bacterium]|nr:AAC(3) family N-acetyltransferase [Ktedonobacteraceae bacterium]MBO0796883.1 AAC(3) family N-acetyltransferase [Ktedonobacteraceae bacterium]